MASQPKGYMNTTHLDTVQLLLDDFKLLTYEQMRLQPGQRVLDVGCGPGTDRIPLARRVGTSGHVVGVDCDEDMIGEAEKRALEAEVGAWVVHKHADATALPFEWGYFDACRCERLFQHLQDPAKALSEMTRVTRPGGWIVALDSAWGSLSIDSPEIEAERRYVRVLAEHITNSGYSGRRLYPLFKQQGLVDVSVQVRGVPFTDYAFARQTLLMDRVEREAMASGVAGVQDVDRLHTCWEEANADGAFFASVSMMLVSGLKP